MQTFMTFKATATTFRNLDRTRHNKQRQEAIQILEALLGRQPDNFYPNHPAINMWRGFEGWLGVYGLFACHTYIMQYGPEGKFKFFEKMAGLFDEVRSEVGVKPPWRYDLDFLESHRSNLIRKEPNRYILAFGEDTPRDAPYLWPENDPVNSTEYILRVSKADRERLAKGERVLPDHLKMDESDGVIL